MKSNWTQVVQQYRFPFILFIGWGLIAIVVNPIGEFPLNDDWSYVLSTKLFAEKGMIDFCDWIAVPLIAQVFYGAVWVKIFGFSFTVLRLSTIALGGLGVIGTYRLLKEHCTQDLYVIIGTLLVAFNPIYFSLSYTFMTDVPFFVCSIWSIRYFLIYLKKKQTSAFYIAVLIALLATLIRQSGLAIFISFAITYLVSNSFRKQMIVKVSLLVLLPILVLYLLPIIIGESHINGRNVALINALFIDFFQNSFQAWKNLPHTFVYLSLFCSPLLVMTLRKASFKWNMLFVVMSLILFVLFLYRGRMMPFWGNIWHIGGVGPIHLKDVMLSSIPLSNQLNFSWYLFTFLAFFSSLTLLKRLFDKGRNYFRKEKRAVNYVQLFVVSFLIVFITPHLYAGMFDRYLLILIPLLLLLTYRKIQSQFRYHFVGIVLILFFVFHSVAGTHDYLAWNRLRWEAIRALERQGESFLTIDGGFEYNGYYGFQDNYQRFEEKSYWWVLDDAYIIHFEKGSDNAYQYVQKYVYYSWLFQTEQFIYVSKRKNTLEEDS